MNARELARDRLTTTSADGKRVQVFPAQVHSGKWKTRRQLFQWSMIALYLVLPWLKVAGHPLLQLDVENRRFSILGQLFFAHEAPTLVFFVLSFFLFIGLVTVVFGRVWCGWACPQSVFIDQIFRKLETWIIGDHLAQKRLHHAPADADKILKLTLKWAAFTAVTLLLTHSFLAYFMGSEQVLQMMRSSPAQNPGSFFAVALMSGIILFDFGWFREQFCVSFCPYGRFQSVLMDESSKIVAYDSNRSSDCIDCFKCVAVCPAGIDIRNGLQIECTTCTACMDACDPVMRKTQKPEGLIRYTSLAALKGQKPTAFRPRAGVYGALFVLCSGIFAYRLAVRVPQDIEVVRAVDIPYQVVKDQEGDWVINHFNIRFHNMDWHEAQYAFALDDASTRAGFRLIAPSPQVAAASGEHGASQFFLKIPLAQFQAPGKVKARLEFVSPATKQNILREVTAIGPKNDL